MYTLELYHHTLSVLVKAYLSNTLQKNNCLMCAVGNLVSNAMGYHLPPTPKHQWACGTEPEWGTVFFTDMDGDQYTRKSKYQGLAKKQLDSTGYNWKDLARIERAFETAGDEQRTDEERVFAGLMAVVDVLADLHGIDHLRMQESKALFTR